VARARHVRIVLRLVLVGLGHGLVLVRGLVRRENDGLEIVKVLFLLLEEVFPSRA